MNSKHYHFPTGTPKEVKEAIEPLIQSNAEMNYLSVTDAIMACIEVKVKTIKYMGELLK